MLSSISLFLILVSVECRERERDVHLLDQFLLTGVCIKCVFEVDYAKLHRSHLTDSVHKIISHRIIIHPN